MKKVSILIPCYNEEENIPALYEAIKNLMDNNRQYAWEALMVNDGSKDRTMEMIKDLRRDDKRVCYLNLSRNFGKEAAMLAGFDHVTGDCMVIMDADLQDPLDMIPGARSAGCENACRCCSIPSCRICQISICYPMWATSDYLTASVSTNSKD